MEATFENVVKGKICPYCGNLPKYIDSAVIYGKSYGNVYYCKGCDAYVGVHKGTNKALGRLANKELREWKKMAHAFFDPLWRKAMSRGRSKREARKAAYKWLAKEMSIELQYCHIGMFDIDQCKQVVNICKPYIVKKTNQ